MNIDSRSIKDFYIFVKQLSSTLRAAHESSIRPLGDDIAQKKERLDGVICKIYDDVKKLNEETDQNVLGLFSEIQTAYEALFSSIDMAIVSNQPVSEKMRDLASQIEGLILRLHERNVQPNVQPIVSENEEDDALPSIFDDVRAQKFLRMVGAANEIANAGDEDACAELPEPLMAHARHLVDEIVQGTLGTYVKKIFIDADTVLLAQEVFLRLLLWDLSRKTDGSFSEFLEGLGGISKEEIDAYQARIASITASEIEHSIRDEHTFPDFEFTSPLVQRIWIERGKFAQVSTALFRPFHLTEEMVSEALFLAVREGARKDTIDVLLGCLQDERMRVLVGELCGYIVSKDAGSIKEGIVQDGALLEDESRLDRWAGIVHSFCRMSGKYGDVAGAMALLGVLPRRPGPKDEQFGWFSWVRARGFAGLFAGFAHYDLEAAVQSISMPSVEEAYHDICWVAVLGALKKRRDRESLERAFSLVSRVREQRLHYVLYKRLLKLIGKEDIGRAFELAQSDFFSDEGRSSLFLVCLKMLTVSDADGALERVEKLPAGTLQGQGYLVVVTTMVRNDQRERALIFASGIKGKETQAACYAEIAYDVWGMRGWEAARDFLRAVVPQDVLVRASNGLLGIVLGLGAYDDALLLAQDMREEYFACDHLHLGDVNRAIIKSLAEMDDGDTQSFFETFRRYPAICVPQLWEATIAVVGRTLDSQTFLNELFSSLPYTRECDRETILQGVLVALAVTRDYSAVSQEPFINLLEERLRNIALSTFAQAAVFQTRDRIAEIEPCLQAITDEKIRKETENAVYNGCFDHNALLCRALGQV